MSRTPTEDSQDDTRGDGADETVGPNHEADPSQAAVRAIVAGTSDPAVILTDELRVTNWSAGAEDLFGWSEEEVVGSEARFVPDGEESKFHTLLNGLSSSEPDGALETVCRTEAGDRVDARVSVSRVELGEGETRYIGIFEDVTRPRSGEETDPATQQQQGTPICVMKAVERLRSLSHVVVQASTPVDITRGVCERLGSADAYSFAWYAAYNPVDEQLTPHQWAGSDVDELGPVELPSPEPDAERRIFARAIATGETRTIREISPTPTLEPAGQFPVEYGSVAAVPVVFEGTTYGVLGLYSHAETTFGPYEQGLLQEAGELIGHGIQAVENSQLLHSETVVELTFRTRGPESIFVQVTEDLDCRLELEAFIPASESAFLAYTSVDGSDPATVVERLNGSSDIGAARVVTEDGPSGTIEYKVNESPVAKLLEYGATVNTATMEDGEETVVAAVSPDADVRALVAGLREAYSNTTLVSKRSVDRPPRTISAAQDPLDDVLTDRQREMIELAYHAGFFRSPRYSTGNEIADSIGISSPTFHLHVRKATNNLLGWLDEQGMFE
jgi:PAS domain S-box-containing protein